MFCFFFQSYRLRSLSSDIMKISGMINTTIKRGRIHDMVNMVELTKAQETFVGLVVKCDYPATTTNSSFIVVSYYHSPHNTQYCLLLCEDMHRRIQFVCIRPREVHVRSTKFHSRIDVLFPSLSTTLRSNHEYQRQIY